LIGANNVRLENIIFENANAHAYGGAIDSKNPNLTIINCEFRNNRAMVGAIILGDVSNNVIIQNCTFINNVAAYSDTSGGGGGGAIDSHASNGRIINCNFIGNSAIGGGGAIVFMFGTNNTVSGCTFNNNIAPNGGAIATLTLGTTLRITNSNFKTNSANYGSAIHSNNNLYLSGNSFSNNKAKTSIALSLPYGIRYNLVSVITDKGKYDPTVVRAVLTKNDNIVDAIWQTNSGSTYIDNKKQTPNNLLANQELILNSKYSLKTDSKGVALIKFNENTLTDFKGLTKTSSGYTYKFSVSYGGNNLYASSSASLSASAKVSNNIVDSYWNLMTKKVTSTKTTTTYAINKTGWFKKAITYTKVSKPSSSGTWKKYNTKTKKWESSKAYTSATSATKVSYKNVKNNVVYLINKTGWYKKSSWIKVSKPSSSGTWKKYNTKTKTWNSSGAYTSATSATKVYYKNTITTSSSVNNGLAPYVNSNLEITTTVNGKSSKYMQKGVYVGSTEDIYLINNEYDKSLNSKINTKDNRVQVNDNTMKNIVKQACRVIDGKITGEKKMEKIFYWQRKRINYQGYKNGHFKATDVHWRMINGPNKKHANCVDQSILLVSLLRTASVPAYFIHAPKGNCYASYGHVYVKAYKSNTVQIILDTTANDHPGKPKWGGRSGSGTSHVNGIFYKYTCSKTNWNHHNLNNT